MALLCEGKKGLVEEVVYDMALKNQVNILQVRASENLSSA